VSPADEAERRFAWRAVERTTSCDKHDKILERRLAQIDSDAAEKKIQDTSALRSVIEQFQQASGKIMDTFK
jgi:hypothetical protein